MLCCSVPSAEVLALTAELQQLGGGDVAVGRAWAGAVIDGTAAPAAAEQLDAAPGDWASLSAALEVEVQPWLQCGFGAAVMLLGGSSSLAASIATAACAGTLGAGGSVGLSWQLLSSGMVRDPWGRRQELPGAGSSRRHGGARLPTSRLGARDAAATAAGGEDAAQPCTLLARTPAELSQLLGAAQAQLHAAAGAAAEAAEPAPAPVALLHLFLAAADGRPSAALHLLHVPAPQGPAAEQQQEALLHMLREAADLHQRRREGEHLLASAKLSPLNQLAAPLLAGNARLFVAADLRAEGGISSISSSSSTGSPALLPLLAAVRHMQAACTKGRAAMPHNAAGTTAALDSWMPAQQFLEQLEQRRLAEQQRRAEAAELAAAVADRRTRLQQGAKERQQAAHVQAAPAALAPPPLQQQPWQQHLQQRRPVPAAAEQGGPGYRPSPYSSPAKPACCAAAQPPQQPSKLADEEGAPAAGQQADPVAQTGPAAALASEPGDLGGQPRGSSADSLMQLRQQFQSLYSLALGQGTASPPAQPAVSQPAVRATAAPLQPAKPPAADHHTIAAGVAAADDVAVHVAALRMQAAAEARRALQAEQQLLGAQPAGGGDAVAAAEQAEFTCAGRYDGQRSCSSEESSAAGGSRPNSGGGLAQQLQGELLLLQHEAAQAAAAAAGAAEETAVAAEAGLSPPAASFADFSAADLASLGDLEGHTASLAALHGRSASRSGSLLEGLRSQRNSSTDERQQVPAGAAGTGEQHGGWLGVGATPQSRPAALATSPLLFLSPSVVAAAQSDAFKSANLPLWSTLPAGNGESRSLAAGSDGIDQPAGSGMSSSHSSWRDDRSSAAGAGRPSSRPPSAASSRRQQQQEAGGPVGSYAAAWRRQAPSARPTAAASPASTNRTSRQRPSSQPPQPLPGAGSSSLADGPSASAAGSLRQPSEAAQSELVPAEMASAEVAGLLEELQREQRISSALLQQLHEVQRQLEEAAALAAAAAAAQQPPMPGVQDPADFNGLLAALQLERQQCAALRQQLELQAQQAEEAHLALEARLHTQQRQLLVAAARCRAWEQGTPLASLFRRYEDDLQHLAAERGLLEEESCQLAALLAAADLERLAAAAQRLPEDPAAVCREHQRKLAQAQAQVRKLQEERAALSKRLQGAERRDRLAELCRRQAESGAKAAAELRQQLAARERQLQAQSLAAAAAAGEAERLRQQLAERDRELGRALADRAELEDIVDSLRKQVAVLKGQLSRDRVLRSMQA